MNAYIILFPLLPAAAYQVKIHTTKPLDSSQPAQILSIDTSKDHLVIPRLRLDTPILDGESPYLVNKGVWRRPNSSTPNLGSNTVLVGHRFTYDGPSIFYNLDKMQKGDVIIMVWKGVRYKFDVTATQTVPASRVDIENATSDKRLTIYTCTPLWSAKDRLVITAALEQTL